MIAPNSQRKALEATFLNDKSEVKKSQSGKFSRVTINETGLAQGYRPMLRRFGVEFELR